MGDFVVQNFTVIESAYGRFIVNRHCDFQAEALIKTGRPHIEAELQKMFEVINTLPNECVVVDGGANIGLVAVPLARAISAKRGTVYAFEPQRMLFCALSGAAALNDLQNLHTFNQALGAKSGIIQVPILDYGRKQDFGLLSLAGTGADLPSEPVLLRPLDELGLKCLDFLKIDVEGMEIEVLEGGRALIKEHLPWCWVEYWKVDIARIKAQFSGLPYKFYTVDRLNLLCAPHERLAAASLIVNAPEV